MCFGELSGVELEIKFTPIHLSTRGLEMNATTFKQRAQGARSII
jgi:hypothetical protein